jgi:hypothetical protein
MLCCFFVSVHGLAQENPADFKFAQNLGTGECFKVLFGDLTGDGFKDAVVINFSSPSKIWINQGDGSFVDSGKSFTGGYNHGGALGDIDGDGDMDLVIVSTMAVDKVFKNDGSGNFTVYQSLGTTSDLTTQVLLADIDGDSDLDLLTAHTLKPNKIWLNDGQGTFSFLATVGGDSSYYMDTADIDLDGDLDLYIEINGQSDIILLNNGQGEFADTGLRVGPPTGDGDGVFCEFNGDQYPDLFIPNDSQGSSVWLNSGGASFIKQGTPFGAGNTVGLLDIDLDGDMDAVLSKFDGTTQLYLNYGDYVFRSYGQQFATEKCWSITCEDVDNDGDTDLVLGNSAMNGRAAKLFLNQSLQSSSVLFESVKSRLKLYPNPAGSQLKIEIDLVQSGNYSVVLTGMDSRTVIPVLSQFLHSGSSCFVYVPFNLAKGVYCCSLFLENRLMAREKVVFL